MKVIGDHELQKKLMGQLMLSIRPNGCGKSEASLVATTTLNDPVQLVVYLVTPLLIFIIAL